MAGNGRDRRVDKVVLASSPPDFPSFVPLPASWRPLAFPRATRGLRSGTGTVRGRPIRLASLERGGFAGPRVFRIANSVVGSIVAHDIGRHGQQIRVAQKRCAEVDDFRHSTSENIPFGGDSRS